ncbi:hypothetical protein CONLIGDRAFT_585111 [Coniochaeta ligniaria NRRL 30616]|uniref:Autophagy protein n=1 Tax=Coniochaeta ligniaria NRRL 30616 TaxID=1408157 RepID=A0A1J7I9F4_9PEZI|nr:hypothetical protein CONLIGDRAFT_585111 [Coniochaeta ligniaria NRRL 30616]
MGWFDFWSSSQSSGGDPLAKLDPKLREFLQREAPIKYDHAQSPHHHTPTPTQDATTAPPPAVAATPTTEPNQKEPAVPPQSLYQDGRYAHLWKNYKPQSMVDAETKSDHEKLMDVLEAYKERKAEIGKAALENCALEQVDWSECMKSGSVTARMTMCRDAVRKFERCYTIQNRFLKALGYLSVQDRSPEVEEDIQMHADRLYHRLMEQEAAVDEAKKEGKPVPKFEPLIPKPIIRITDEREDISLSPHLQRTLKEQLEKVPEEERHAEEEAIKAELRAKAEVAARVQDIWAEQAREKEQRRKEGKLTIGDRVSGLFGW